MKNIISIFLISLFLTTLGSVEASESEKENVLRLLVWEGYTPENYIKKFEEQIFQKYKRKVKLSVRYTGSSDDFFNPIRDKEVDLVTVSHHSIKDKQYGYIEKGLLLQPELINIPNHVNVLTNIKNASYNLHEGKVYSIPVASGPYGLAYNTDVLSQPPQTWKIFWNPKYKHKYALGAQEYLYNINITALSMGYPLDSINSFDKLNNSEFKQKLRQLAENAGSYWIGVDKPQDLIGMSFGTSWGDSLTTLRKMGEPWKMAEPAEGTMWWVDVYAIAWALSDKPFLKKVAEEWINISLTPDFQVNHLIREVGIYPVVSNISDRLTKEEKQRIANPESEKMPDNRIFQRNYSQRDRNGLRLLWEKAMSGVDINRKN